MRCAFVVAPPTRRRRSSHAARCPRRPSRLPCSSTSLILRRMMRGSRVKAVICCWRSVMRTRSSFTMWEPKKQVLDPVLHKVLHVLLELLAPHVRHPGVLSLVLREEEAAPALQDRVLRAAAQQTGALPLCSLSPPRRLPSRKRPSMWNESECAPHLLLRPP